MASLTLKQCLISLARAEPGSGFGFTKTDREWGIKMANTSVNESEWTPRQKYYCWDMLRKYRSQLRAFGMDFQTIPIPPRPDQPAAVAAPVQKVVQEAVRASTAYRVEMPASARYHLFFPAVAEMLEAIKKLPNRNREWFGGNTRDQRRYWVVRMYPEALDGAAIADLNNFLEKYRFDVPTEVRADIQFLLASAQKQKIEREQAYVKSFATDAEIVIPGLGGTLFGFQKAGVLYAREKKCAIIADEMGLGKTPQALATVEVENAFPALIVCKAALRRNWIKEIRTWLPERRATTDPADMEYRMMQILVVSYEGLVRWYDKLEEIDWKAVVVDESQMIKHHSSKRTKACKDIAKVSKAPVRLCLTGTPIEICPYEFAPQLAFLGQMGAVGGSEHFYEYFCQSDRRGSAHLDELNALLRKTCYIRRLKKDVLGDLPAKQRAYVDLDIENAEEYNRAKNDILGWLKAEVARRPEAFNADPDALVHDGTVKEKQDYVARKAQAALGLVKINHLKQIAVMGMLEPAKMWIEDFLESGEKLIVFADHIEVQRQVYHLFKDLAVWTRSGAGPQTAVDAFQNDPKTRLIVCSQKADNAGHTLTAASNVCHIEPGWTPTIHDQCDDRAHRIGQKDSVTGWYLRAMGTIYEDIYELLDERRKIVNDATNGTLTAGQQQSILSQLVKKITR